MSLRKVAVMGHPVLRQVAAPVPEKDIVSPKIQELLKDMRDTMFEYDGRGLAAPQIHESLQIVVMVWDFEPDKDPAIVYLINPTIEPLTDEFSSHWEGCLSIPGLRGKVSRPNRIRVRYLTPKKEKVDVVVEGFAATVIQHECDHLMGKLYVDHISDMTLLAFNREYSRYIAPTEQENPDEDAEADRE